MKITKWLAALAAFVIVTGMTIAGCKNNSDDDGYGDETCVVTFYPDVPKNVTGAENLAPQKQTYLLGSTQQYPEDLFSIAGYHIIGWSYHPAAFLYNNINNVMVWHKIGENFTVYRDIDFYAVWKKIEQITIDGIIYVYETDDEGNDYCEVYKASNTTGITVANIRSEVAGIPVTSIGTNAFNGCYNLTSVTMPDGVTKIKAGAFSGCSKLTSITIPDTVEYINYSTFENCRSLTTVSIPNSVTKIGNDAFSGCVNLTSVTIPESVTEIGEYAFYRCTNLTSIEIPCAMAYIRKGAFGRCINLTEMTLPWWYGDYEKFGYIFYYTEDQIDSKSNNSFVPQSLKKVTITGGNIGYSMFAECGDLTSVIIGDGVTSIKGQPFNGCSGLTTVEISDGMVANIGSFVFKGCGNLTTITIGEGNPVYSCQDKILYNKDKTSIICALETINGAVTIPNSVTSIGYRAFEGCSGLTNIEIPDSVTEIEEGAFGNCSGLTSISISNNVTKIGKDVFSNCGSLKSVTIPDSVTEIGEGAFSNCSGLTSIEIPGNVTSIAAEVFNKCTGLKNVIYTGTLVQWCAMVDVSFLMQYAEHVIISDGNDLKSMTELVIPNVVTGINAYAFYGCKNLTSVTISDSVKYIGNSAFKGCKSLTSIEISNGVTCIEESAFESCTKLASVTIPNSVTSIENGAFRGCSRITEMHLPFTGASRNETNNTYFDYIFGGTVSSISSSAYNSLVPQSLKKVIITGNYIRDYAFRGCTSLTSVTILYGTASIGAGSFTNCKNLADVTIPNSVTGISTMAFYGCMGLKLINFGGTKAQWNSIKKGSYWDYSTGGIEGQVVGSYRGYTVACTDGNI